VRRSDKLFALLAWGALLAGLAWALSTQFRLVQEAKPIQLAKPPAGPVKGAVEGAGEGSAETAPPPPGTGVIGTVSDDTRAAMAKGLRARRPAPSEAQVPPRATPPPPR
jgi:hypothetical protein